MISLPCRNDDFGSTRALPVFGRNEDDNYAYRLATSRLRPGFRELSTLLGGNLLADGIAVGRGGGLHGGYRDRKGARDRAIKWKTTSHAALLAHRG
jgi:hypothetical protein